MYNIHLAKHEDITDVPRPTIPTAISGNSTIKLTVDALHQNFQRKDTISDDFETAHSLLDTTKGIFGFLILLLRQAHTKLLVKPSASKRYKILYINMLNESKIMNVSIS